MQKEIKYLPKQDQRITSTPSSTLGFKEVTHSQGTGTLTVIKHVDHDLYLNDASKPLLNRLCVCVPELLLYTLKNSDWKTILLFRSISKEFNYFASITHPCYLYNPLVDKTTISFVYAQLYPLLDAPTLEKWNFVSGNEDEKMESQIIASPSDDLSKLTQAIFASKNRLIVFTIKSNDDLNPLQTFCSNLANTQFLHRLKTLNFSELYIDTDNINDFNTILTTISNNLDSLSSLQTIVIGEVCPVVSLQIPPLLENSQKIVYKNAEENNGIFTLSNIAKVAFVGIVFYKAYRYFYPRESSENKKKDQ